MLTDHKGLVNVYREIIPELCRFPFSFIKTIEMNSFTFIDTIIFLKSPDLPLVHKKIYKGLFPVKSEENFKKLFYKMIVYGIKAKYLDMDDLWEQSVEAASIESRTVIIGRRLVVKPRNLLEEQSETLMDFMKRPIEYLFGKNELKKKKGAIFQKALEEIDPIGINAGWWHQLEELTDD